MWHILIKTGINDTKCINFRSTYNQFTLWRHAYLTYIHITYNTRTSIICILHFYICNYNEKIIYFCFLQVDIGWLVRKGRRKGGELAKEGVWKAREGEEVEEGKE